MDESTKIYDKNIRAKQSTHKLKTSETRYKKWQSPRRQKPGKYGQ